MSGQPRLRTVVANTSALVSLGVPRAASDHDTGSAPDPFQYLHTSCDVVVPHEVVSELHDIAQYHDIHGVAAHNLLEEVKMLFQRGQFHATSESRRS